MIITISYMHIDKLSETKLYTQNHLAKATKMICSVDSRSIIQLHIEQVDLRTPYVSRGCANTIPLSGSIVPGSPLVIDTRTAHQATGLTSRRNPVRQTILTDSLQLLRNSSVDHVARHDPFVPRQKH